ncbi:glycosyltransferase [Lithospermum erythrorhizon]|uniref:Glycosyltransferase n=1 Tax=Lithospermum erythrorhizon TaxID=34254 RepID=A0AAV3PLX6_LITER
MLPEVYYPSKKRDDFCDEVCGQSSLMAYYISRVRYMFQCLDVKSFIYLFIILPLVIFGTYTHGQKITYFLRPLWQSPPKPFIDIPHYYSENVTMENLCSLHGWKVREYPRRVYDAVIFNNEIDMLTIRWKELYPYITQFVLLESNSTFTGLPKPYFFAMNREQFSFVEPRLTYATVSGRFHKGENPFVEEAYERLALDKLLGIAGIEDDDLLIMSDVDEIPSAHTINLLRWCDDIPPVLHLELKNYMYSFEFRREHKSWRASVHRYQKGMTKYVHFRQTDLLLADAGWHCSFCFRLISDFVFKMKAYSHTDRIKFAHFLNHDRIQDIICRGADLFDMLPEEYTFKDIIGRMGPLPHSYSGVNLPSLLYDSDDKYKYLLPGNCKRESE